MLIWTDSEELRCGNGFLNDQEKDIWNEIQMKTFIITYIQIIIYTAHKNIIFTIYIQ